MNNCLTAVGISPDLECRILLGELTERYRQLYAVAETHRMHGGNVARLALGQKPPLDGGHQLLRHGVTAARAADQQGIARAKNLDRLVSRYASHGIPLLSRLRTVLENGTPRSVPGRCSDHRWHHLGADRFRDRAACAESAAGRRIERARGFALQRQPLAPLLDSRIGNRHRGNEITRVGMQRLGEQLVRRATSATLPR